MREAPSRTTLHVKHFDSITIKQDSEGRFCLNDLHKSSGGAEKDAPAKFLRTDTAEGMIKELVNEIEAGNPAANAVTIVRGRGITGTYVVKELVYAYAMWISPAFHLKVIRFFDRGATPRR